VEFLIPFEKMRLKSEGEKMARKMIFVVLIRNLKPTLPYKKKKKKSRNSVLRPSSLDQSSPVFRRPIERRMLGFHVPDIVVWLMAAGGARVATRIPTIIQDPHLGRMLLRDIGDPLHMPGERKVAIPTPGGMAIL